MLSYLRIIISIITLLLLCIEIANEKKGEMSLLASYHAKLSIPNKQV